MASRYNYTTELATKNTKRKYLSSVIYPKVKPTDNDMYIISESSDRLDILANKYYGDKTYWWVISVANNLNDASLHIQPGIQLRIPSDLPSILREFEKINK
jgi:nucleoid-associated protein YgaU